METIRKIFQQFVTLFSSKQTQKLRSTELEGWTELQIASLPLEENFSIEQSKISELIIHHTRQINHIIFAIEDLIPSNQKQINKNLFSNKKIKFQQDNNELAPEFTSLNDLNNHLLPPQKDELNIILREIKTLTLFLRDIFQFNPHENQKKTITNKIKHIEISLHSLSNNSNSIKKVHKISLQQTPSKSPWQDHVISILEEIYRLETTLNSMKNILLQSRQGRFGPLLETAQILNDLTNKIEEIQKENVDLLNRKNSTINSRKDIENELQLIESSKEYQEINNLQSQETDLNSQLEKIEDSLYLLFANLKDSLSNLADLNSDYELLEIIKVIEDLQADPLQYFTPKMQDNLLPLLNWVLAKIASDDLITPKEDHNPFNSLHHKIISNDMKVLNERYSLIIEQKKSLPKIKMQNPLYANSQNLRYKRDHYLSQENKFKIEQQSLKEKLGMVTSKAMQYKGHFEELAKLNFNIEVEIELR